MTTVEPKSPCQEIDEEERRNHHEPTPVPITAPPPAPPPVVAPPVPPIPPVAPAPPELDSRRSKLRCEIDVITYESRLKALKENLELERRRDYLKLISEVRDQELRNKKRKLEAEIDLMELDIKLKKKRLEHNEWVHQEPRYLTNPIVHHPEDDSVEIVVSDRIIMMPVIIGYQTASYISDRIDYYNNRDSKLPIFIIIDVCFGGSVASGYQIQKRIEASSAPVYYVVRSFAASMAAFLVGSAQYSCIYPNAIILHHQIYSGYQGNITLQREKLDETYQWWQRLAGPLVSKLGTSLDTWVQKMYQASQATGDWKLFGDDAQKHGWVGTVVDKINITGRVKNPDTVGNGNGNGGGSCCQVLPKLYPFDHYWVYNPDGHFRIGEC